MFSSIEQLALEQERQGEETVEQVVHRLIAPLVARHTQTRFNSLMSRFSSSSVSRQAEIIAEIERSFPEEETPPPPVEPEGAARRG